MSVLGKENSQGEFEVSDICIAGLPKQPEQPEQIYPRIQMNIGLFQFGLSQFGPSLFLFCFVLHAYILKIL